MASRASSLHLRRQLPYDATYNRGPSIGPNSWYMTAPDGGIDLPNDVLGVILQYQHNCR